MFNKKMRRRTRVQNTAHVRRLLSESTIQLHLLHCTHTHALHAINPPDAKRAVLFEICEQMQLSGHFMMRPLPFAAHPPGADGDGVRRYIRT